MASVANKTRKPAEQFAYLMRNDPCPGTGPDDTCINDWIFRAAIAARNAKVPASDASELIRECMTRPEKGSEVSHAIENAYHTAPLAHSKQEPTWPAFEQDLWRANCNESLGLNDLLSQSPIAVEGVTALESLQLLFPDDPLLCLGKSAYAFHVCKLSEASFDISELSLIVPNPASTRLGLTQSGNKSAHAASMFPTRRYLVVEFDKRIIRQPSF